MRQAALQRAAKKGSTACPLARVAAERTRRQAGASCTLQLHLMHVFPCAAARVHQTHRAVARCATLRVNTSRLHARRTRHEAPHPLHSTCKLCMQHTQGAPAVCAHHQHTMPSATDKIEGPIPGLREVRTSPSAACAMPALRACAAWSTHACKHPPAPPARAPQCLMQLADVHEHTRKQLALMDARKVGRGGALCCRGGGGGVLGETEAPGPRRQHAALACVRWEAVLREAVLLPRARGSWMLKDAMVAPAHHPRPRCSPHSMLPRCPRAAARKHKQVELTEVKASLGSHVMAVVDVRTRGTAVNIDDARWGGAGRGGV